MEIPAISSPVEGSETETSKQVTETSQDSQQQETARTQVEGNGQSTSHEDIRQKSEFETARQIKNLMKEVRSLKQSLETRSSVQQPATQQQKPSVTREELLNDPLAAINKMIEARTSEVKQEIPQALKQRESEWKREQAWQEGLKMIRTNETIRKDPEGEERVKEILLEEDEDGNSLEAYSQVNPKHAAQLALIEYQNRFGKRNVHAPSKSQMASTATSQTSGVRSTTDQEIAQMYKEIASVPGLANDPEFMAKMAAILKKSDMEAKMGK